MFNNSINMNQTNNHLSLTGAILAGFTTTCTINAYYHYRCDFEPLSWQDVLDTTLCDKVSQ